MNGGNSFVLDSSALLAYLLDELGSNRVAEALVMGCVMSSVNWAEVLSKLVDGGASASSVTSVLRSQGLLEGAIIVVPLEEQDARGIAELRPGTRSLGLSLGDRACLFLGLRLRLPILTADHVWTELRLEIEIEDIRA